MATTIDPRFNEALIPFLARSMPFTNQDFVEFEQAIQDWPEFYNELRGVFKKAVHRYRDRACTRIPTTFTVGDRTYELISIVESEDRQGSDGNRLEWLADHFNARLGKDDAEYIYEHRNELPKEYMKVSVVMMFLDWIVKPHLYWHHHDKFGTLFKIDGRWVTELQILNYTKFYTNNYWLIRRIA